MKVTFAFFLWSILPIIWKCTINSKSNAKPMCWWGTFFLFLYTCKEMFSLCCPAAPRPTRRILRQSKKKSQHVVLIERLPKPGSGESLPNSQKEGGDPCRLIKFVFMTSFKDDMTSFTLRLSKRYSEPSLRIANFHVKISHKKKNTWPSQF